MLWVSAAMASILVLESVRVVDANGERSAEVLVIDGDRIVHLGDDTGVWAGAERRSIAGKTVIPGLVDAHGHLAGDALLVALVDDWQSLLRRTDILSRTGGDEFVLVLPGTTRVDAEALVARLRAANPAPSRFAWSASRSTRSGVAASMPLARSTRPAL